MLFIAGGATCQEQNAATSLKQLYYVTKIACKGDFTTQCRISLQCQLQQHFPFACPAPQVATIETQGPVNALLDGLCFLTACAESEAAYMLACTVYEADLSK